MGGSELRVLRREHPSKVDRIVLVVARHSGGRISRLQGTTTEKALGVPHEVFRTCLEESRNNFTYDMDSLGLQAHQF